MIGVLDWGIGGVDALVRLSRAVPAQYVYRSDSGFEPYGKVPPDVLAKRLDEVGRELAGRYGIEALVLACNAASAVLPRLTLPFPVLGVIAPGVALVRRAVADGARHIGIIGGEGTIASGAHRAALADLEAAEAAGVRIVARPAQALSAHVEAGRLDGPEVDAEVARVARALGEDGPIDALLLACTHYPALSPVFARHFPGVRLLDPVDLLIEDASTRLGGWADGRTESAWIVETSGDPESTQVHAWRAFGVALGRVRKSGLDLADDPIPARERG